MGGDDGKKPDTKDGPLDGHGYSSLPCMLHELDHASPAPAMRERAPPAPDAQEWEEVRLWRRAKRAALIERRLAIPAAERALHSQAITAALRKVLSLEQRDCLGFYWPFKGEYDPRPLVRSLHAEGVRLALPVVTEKRRPMIFRPWWPGAPTTLGIWNILVPAQGEAVEPDILLVPLVGFDRRRFRLGYGGGYYDCTLLY